MEGHADDENDEDEDGDDFIFFKASVFNDRVLY